MPSACVSLPGPEQRILLALHAPPRLHGRDFREWLQRADQDRCPDPLGLANRVQQRVDAIGAIDVRAARRPEERRGTRGEPDESVTGGLAVVVGLRLHDHTGRTVVFDDAADQRPRNRQHGPRIELGRQNRHRSANGRALQDAASQLQLLAHSRQRGPALGDLGLQPRILAQRDVVLLGVRAQQRAVRRELRGG